MVKIVSKDFSFANVFGDREDLLKIFNHFGYFVANYKFQPLYKQGRWDGKIKLFNFVEKTIPLGLVPQLKQFLETERIDYEEHLFEDDNFVLDMETLEKFIIKLKIPFEVRDYQKDLILVAINNRQSVSVAATGSGKSLAIYIICMLMIWQKKRTFLIVPSLSLVHQMYSDFISYGMPEENAEKMIHCIYGGQEKSFTKPIIISTWQSIYKPSVIKEYTSKVNATDLQYDCIIADEAHLIKAGEEKKVSDIIESFTHSPWKIGVTGSMPRDELARQQIIAALGEPVDIIRATELVERGYATDLNVTALFLKYNEIDSKYLRSSEVRKKWTLEEKFVNEHTKKHLVIKKLIQSKINKNENTIVFFKNIDYGKILLKIASEMTEHVYYIDGTVDGKIREQIRKDIEEGVGVVIVASFKTFSTGINIKKIHNGIFAQNPGKSDTTLIQSLGRFLRQHESKDIANVYDIIDDARSKNYTNFCYRHFEQRLEVYRSQGWYINEVTMNV